jgi:hypothetical protein
VDEAGKGMSEPLDASLVPSRACADVRLWADHWRLLVALGTFSHSEAGIDAPLKLIAARANLDPHTAFRVLTELAAWGYVVDGVRGAKSYRVLFNSLLTVECMDAVRRGIRAEIEHVVTVTRGSEP